MRTSESLITSGAQRTYNGRGLPKVFVVPWVLLFFLAFSLQILPEPAAAMGLGRSHGSTISPKNGSHAFPITQVGQTSSTCRNVCYCSDVSNCTCDQSGWIDVDHDLSLPFSANNYRLQSANSSNDCAGGSSISFPVFVNVGQKLSYSVEFSPTSPGSFSDYLNLSGYIFSVSGSTPSGEASLVPSAQSGWSAPLVVSTTSGTQIDSPTLTNTEPLYLSWSIQNQGDLSTFGTFFVDVSLDGSLLGRWSWSDSLQPGWYLFLKDYQFGPLSAGTHKLELVPDPSGVIGASSSTYTKTISVSNTTHPSPLPLVFPLKASAPNRDRQLRPYSVGIITVFDHSMTATAHKNGFWPYGCNQDVIAFTGEEGNVSPSPSGSACADHPGFSQSGNKPFNITGHYTGDRADGPAYLNYEGHPGFDFAAVAGTQVFASVSGTVFYPSTAGALGLSDPYSTFHVLGIIPDDDPSYRVYYLHLSSHPSKSGTKGTFSDPSPAPGCPAQVKLPIPAGQHVNAGCLVALSGAAGAPGGAHLHFEVHKVLDVSAGSISSASKRRCLADPTLNDSSHACVPVDPYGWLGSVSDPYTALTGVENIYLWADPRP